MRLTVVFRKKLWALTAILVLMALFLATAAFAGSNYYSVLQLADTPSAADQHPEINDDGWVTWFAKPYGGQLDLSTIYLYDGTSTTQLGTGWWPRISNNGRVTWHDSNGKIFYYDGTSTTQLGTGWWPRISNNNGQVTWYGNGIWLFDGTSTVRLSTSGANPRVNNNGWVAWTQNDGGDSDIFLYDGTSTIQLTHNDGFDGYHSINDNGWVAWSQRDSATAGFPARLMVYDGASTTKLADSAMIPAINNNNQVVWSAWGNPDLTPYDLWLYDGSSTVQLASGLDSGNVEIGDNGWITYIKRERRYTGAIGGVAYAYDGSIEYRLMPADELIDSEWPQISDNGKVVFYGSRMFSGASQIFMATPGPGNTPASDTTVTVEPTPGVEISFPEVIESGQTLVNTKDAPYIGAPGAFRFFGSEFTISTDASYTLPLQVTLPYSDAGLSEQSERSLKLFQHNGTNWIDVTVVIDAVNNTITGEVNSLSRLAIGKPVVLASVETKSKKVSTKAASKRYFTVYVRLPEEYNVSDISLGSIVLRGRGIRPPQPDFKELVDDDRDGVPDYLKAEFYIFDVLFALGSGEVDFELTFNLLDGTQCVGKGTTIVVDRR